MFDRVLIANRGEIAVRIIRTLRRMGIGSVAVYTPADRGARHVEMAHEAVELAGDRGYLDSAAVIAAAQATGATAVHPGYGFLSENAAFARDCEAAGLVFIGPPANAIEKMGDKIRAKETVAASGVPVVPAWAPGDPEVVFPVLVKPSAGGGGKGMRLVTSADDLPAALEAGRREAEAAFGDGTLMIERYMVRPRHIEVQVFADRHGTCVSLGERECSLQRRHQKIVEEAPSPWLDGATREAMSASAVAAAVACAYVGAGTVEFIASADHPGEYFFMEMNTRLQVEHAVTEMVLGVDLVEMQLRVAAGERLRWADQTAVPAPHGHAVEARVYAEDPGRGFLPSSGRVLALGEPGGEGSEASVRVDSALATGLEIGTAYDPMLAKVIAWGTDRSAAFARLDTALAGTTILGLTTNIGFLRRLLADSAVAAGELDTGLVERKAAELAGAPVAPDAVLAAAAYVAFHADGSDDASGDDPWSVRDGWRVGDRAPLVSRWRTEAEMVEVRLSGGTVSVGGRDLGEVGFAPIGEGSLAVELVGRRSLVRWVVDGDDQWMGCEGEAWKLGRERLVRMHWGGAGAAYGRVTSPMPGTVLTVAVQPGQTVTAGEALVVVEAMKMEHSVVAAEAGTVTEVLVAPGDSVRLDQPLVVLDRAGTDPPDQAADR
jgi:acetyl-CoA/propionyl-CoA carboxylase, biotin carboxylase, biotin carboxyl carrier protein